MADLRVGSVAIIRIPVAQRERFLPGIVWRCLPCRERRRGPSVADSGTAAASLQVKSANANCVPPPRVLGL